jgi:hypothetical protein
MFHEKIKWVENEADKIENNHAKKKQIKMILTSDESR